jgi:hypothetical protein
MITNYDTPEIRKAKQLCNFEANNVSMDQLLKTETAFEFWLANHPKEHPQYSVMQSALLHTLWKIEEQICIDIEYLQNQVA